MRKKATLWLLLTGMIVMTLMLSGCFFSEQTLIIGPDGTTDIKIEFWFQEGQAGDQGSIGIQKLLYLFPELQSYEITKDKKDIEYSTYLIYTFKKDNVDINNNEYVDFTKRDDGSYLLLIRIPKIIEEEKDENDKMLTITVTMPAEIDMANTMRYSENTVEWELRINDFTRDITLKAFTVPPQSS